ncbi:MAG: prenyltransferase/squalene oxidase repeat-containing protein [Phycisphaeraceae bacterium]
MPSLCLALDPPHEQKAEAAIARAYAFLRSSQLPDGSWSPKPGPAITGLVTTAFLRDPNLTPADPTLAKSLAYISSFVKPDGGIYSSILKNYNTSLCLMALSHAGNNPIYKPIIENAQQFLVKLQWVEGLTDPQGQTVTPSHPYFGGSGYNDSSSGRPDGSNTDLMLAALHDSGYDCNSPAFKRAIVFVSRLQGAATNDLLADQIVPDGGFIYATSTDAQHPKLPQTRTNDQLTETAKSTGEYDGPLPTYGSMTYGGYMSFLYAQLSRTDPRVIAARAWIANNYTVESNPNMGEKSYFYYMHFLARAFAATGEKSVATSDGQLHDWANELIDALLARQQPDGSWSNKTDKWMEGDPNLATAYALNALQLALGRN